MYKTCLDDLIKSYSTIERYPILELYMREPDLFFNEYLIIEEDDSVSICKRDASKILTIEKSNFDLTVSDLSLFNVKKDNKYKLFSLGNIEIYRRDIN